MIDIESEKPISIGHVRGLSMVQRDGKAPHYQTVRRWMDRGVGGVRLETINVGGIRCTTREAVVRFCQRLNAPSPGATTRTPAQRAAAVERARAILQRAGV